jgi:4-amino-4-deoxy-L-arabinose transferase-like glycosyltransferase
LAALFCALSFAAKFTAVVLLPMFLLFGLWQVWRHRQQWATAALRYAGMVSAMLLVSWGGLWAVYGFRYSSARDPQQAAQVEARLFGQSKHGGHHPLEDVVRHAAATKQLLPLWPDGPPLDAIAKAAPTAPLRWSDKALLFAARHQLVPESYLFGFAWAEMKSQVRSSFLRGQHSNTGFWNYFLWTFLLKTPVATLLALAGAIGWAVWRRQAAAVWLLVPPLVHLGISMTSNMNIGHRHLLPMYPFLFVLCGGLATVWARWALPLRRGVAVGVLALLAAGAFVVWWRPAVVYPNYLAYFNELAGGPKRGAENLVDSNLDWGQDLPRLKQWLDDHQVREPIALCYFGMADPVYHGISYLNLPGGYPFAPTSVVPTRGYLVVSATNLKGVYFSKDGQAFWQQLLRRATLIDTVGYSLFIFRLSPPTQ